MKFSTVLTAGLLVSAANAAALPVAEAEAHKPTTTVTVTMSGPTTTHKYGKFNNTHHESHSTSTSTGTHKHGKFNNTHHDETTTTVYEGDAAHAINNPFTMKNSVIGWSVGAVGCAAAAMLL